MAVDPEMLQKFLSFAVKEGRANPAKFKARMYHVVNGRTPTAYIALLLADFFHKRKYEDVVRKVVDHVEYVTDDGKTEDLERFVNQHPLQLRILRVKRRSIKPNADEPVAVVLRSPVKMPEFKGMREELVSKHINEKWNEFKKWLAAQEPLPQKLTLLDGRNVPINYEADIFEGKYVDEWDFEEQSNLSGQVSISEGIDLILLCSQKDKAPRVRPDLLDLFYSLCEVLGRDWQSKKPESYSAKRLWDALAIHDATILPHAFFQERQFFSPAATTALEKFFEQFATKHASLGRRARKDYGETERQGDAYVAKPEVLRLYTTAKQEYAEGLAPILNAHREAIADSLLKIMEVQAGKAKAHFTKLRGVLDNTGTAP